MDSHKSKLLIALSASAFGAVVLSIAIYKRFFAEKDSQKKASVEVEASQELEVSPPVQFKNKLSEEEEVVPLTQPAEDSDNSSVEIEEEIIAASAASTSSAADMPAADDASDNLYNAESVEELIVPASQTQAFAEQSSSTNESPEEEQRESEVVPTMTSEKEESLGPVSSDVNADDELLDALESYAEMKAEGEVEGSSDAMLSRSQGSDDSMVVCSSVADSGIGLPNTTTAGVPLTSTQSSVSAGSSDIESDAAKSADEVKDQLTPRAASPANHSGMDAPNSNADSTSVEDTSVPNETAEKVEAMPVAEEKPAAQPDNQMNGTVEQAIPQRVVHSFLMPESICGRFIGKGGRNISALKHETRTNIKVGREAVMPTFKLCTVEGFPEHVARAVRLIQKQYPEVDVNSAVAAQPPFPSLTLSADRMQSHLPLGVLLDVVISDVVCAGHVFIQQPTHPMFLSWQRMDSEMNLCYGNGTASPLIPPGCEDGILCVACRDGRWHRAQVMAFSEDRQSSDVKLVDVGGYVTVPTSDLRPIRADFLCLPFQAVECYLANISPLDGEMYTEEANEALRAMTSSQLVQCQPICNDEHTGIPYIHVICQHENKTVVVNKELANRGLVSWYDMSE